MRSRVVSRLLTSPNLSESATLVRQEAGCRNEYGEYIGGLRKPKRYSGYHGALEQWETASPTFGRREEETRRFWTRESLEAFDGHVGDMLEYLGELFLAMRVESWADGFVDVLG